MTKTELLKILRECQELGEVETAHVKADRALIAFIEDDDIEEAYQNVDKWYS